ncbi:MAG TPA: DUF1579 family protein [Terriglobales bacterium]|nr:DUF1579 family protein [Terriglobales bacterium]
MPTPAAELGKLDYFVGTWRLEGEVEPNSISPGGHLIETDQNDWMDGGFFLVVRSEFTISGMNGASGVAYLGYDPNEKLYTYDEFNSMGEAIHSKGFVDGDTWIWSGERKMDTGIVKTQWVVKIRTAVTYDFKFEMSPDGTTWTTVVEGKAIKQP